jgi:hypothetical protein
LVVLPLNEIRDFNVFLPMVFMCVVFFLPGNWRRSLKPWFPDPRACDSFEPTDVGASISSVLFQCLTCSTYSFTFRRLKRPDSTTASLRQTHATGVPARPSEERAGFCLSSGQTRGIPCMKKRPPGAEKPEIAAKHKEK